MRMHLFAVTAVLVTGLAACGGGKGSDGVASAGGGAKGAGATTSPQQSLSPQDARLKFAQCMRQNGIDMPDPGSDGAMAAGKAVKAGDSAGARKQEAAMKKCTPYLQAGGQGPDLNDPKVRDQMVKFAGCMRRHGIDMPDPKPGNTGLAVAVKDPGKLQKAEDACKQFAPGAK
jgi:hypothetical protein